MRIIFVLLLFVSTSLAASEDLLMGYTEFYESMRSHNFSNAEKYILPDTQIGFGPDEMGVKGFHNLVVNNQECLNDLVFALRQGCKISEDQDSEICIAPPQSDDDSVLYLGARVGFKRQVDGPVSVQYIICGGD